MEDKFCMYLLDQSPLLFSPVQYTKGKEEKKQQIFWLCSNSYSVKSSEFFLNLGSSDHSYADSETVILQIEKKMHQWNYCRLQRCCDFIMLSNSFYKDGIWENSQCLNKGVGIAHGLFWRGNREDSA